MMANPILLQKKYVRVVGLFAKEYRMSVDEALRLFYKSLVYQFMSEGVSDMHCMSEQYLVQELAQEYKMK